MKEYYYANCPVCSDGTRNEVCPCELALYYIGEISPLITPGQRRKWAKETVKWYKHNIQHSSDKYAAAWNYIHRRPQPTLWEVPA